MACLPFLRSMRFGRIKRFGELYEELSVIEGVKLYSYTELKIATNDFSDVNMITDGGFGPLYKGKLKKGEVVAVKVVNVTTQEFLTEIKVIADIEHEHLVKLYGYCILGDRRLILIYEYLENNSLAQTLLGRDHSKIQFSWRTRTRICIGVARGLAFLHEGVRPPIVHSGIQAASILLDRNMTAKISDCGLAKIQAEVTCVFTNVAGERHGNIIRKNKLVVLVDACLNGNFNPEEACKILKIGLLCTQELPELRPTMSDVVKMLSGEMNCNEKTITKPLSISGFRH